MLVLMFVEKSYIFSVKNQDQQILLVRNTARLKRVNFDSSLNHKF
jgi:hypothetical protein